MSDVVLLLRRVGETRRRTTRTCTYVENALYIHRNRERTATTFCIFSARLVYRHEYSDKGGLEILYDCADGIDRDGDLDLADGELDAYRDKKSAKELNQLEVAIGDGMEFTIHGKRVVYRVFCNDSLLSYD